MELLKFFLFISLASSALAFVPQLFTWKEGQNYFFYNDEEGQLILVDLTQTEPPSILRSFKETHVKYHLHTRKNPTEQQVIDPFNVTTLKNSNFNKKNPTKVIIHGWNNNYKSDMFEYLVPAFLNNADMNVFVVDWSKGSNTLYTSAASNAITVGKYLANFVKFLVSQGVTMKNLHILGHSLGAHAAGIAARNLDEKPAIVTGFDPAAPLWTTWGERIRPSDAAYVEIIHTNAGNLGIYDTAGHNDFYPNGGASQPGCGWMNVACDHGRSYLYYAYSIDNAYFMGNLCKDNKEASKNKCSNLGQLHLGGTKAKPEMGSFYLKTSKKAPFYIEE